MNKFFNYDTGFWRFFGKLGDLIILNLLTILFSLPIITIGASVTAAHYASIKIRRDESYVMRNFWKSFKMNFKQSTLVWLFLLMYTLGLVFTISMLSVGGEKVVVIMQGFAFALAVFSLFTVLWMFPLQARFVNSIFGTIRNAFILAVRHLLRSIGMVLVSALPIVLILFVGPKWYSLLFLFGVSVPIYLCTLLYNKVSEKMEEQFLVNTEESESEVLEITQEDENA